MSPEHDLEVQRCDEAGGSCGQVMVEAAITMLLLFVFVFAIFEAGRLIQTQQALTYAARAGARRSVAPLTKTLPGTLATDVEAVVNYWLATAHLTGATIAVDQAYTIPPAATTYTRVTVTYQYSVMTLSMFGMLNIPLTGQSLMRNETSK